MDKLCEELDETKAELEKLRADYRSKVELFERLKRAHNEQLTIIQEASTKLEKQAQELNEKEEEISIVKQMYEDVKSSWNEKESIIKSLTAINDKLRFGSEEKFQKLEERERKLIYALDEANEKNIDQEQKINVFKAEIEGLKGMLSLSQNKCLEAEKRAKASKELRARDDVLLKLEEENRKIEERLKWKEEQFKHLEDAHEKLRDQFKVTKKEWELEKSTLVDEIYSLQTSLESQTRISEDLQNRLKLCNQALAHEESRRKYLEVEVSEYKTRFDNVFIECQDTKAQLVSLSAQRDKEIAALRHSLGTKETYYKEMEYRAGRLEQENEELLASLKELQEAQIYQTGSSSSLAKLRNKLKSVEQMYRDFSANFRAKEAEWSSQLEKMTEDLNDCRSELEIKIASIEELKIELEGCHSLIMQLRMQNEESSVMLLVLQSVISETQLKLTDVEAEMGFHNKEREERVSRLMKHLETMNAALATAQKDIDEEREKSASLLRRVESLYDIEDQQLLMQKELQRYKEMLEESSNCQLRIKEQALQTECDLKDKLRGVCDALDTANSELVKEREKAASLSIKVESLEVIEGQLLLMQKELERCKEMLDESSRYQLHLEGQVLQIESDSKEKLREVCNALDTSNSELTEEREKVASLSRRVESLDRIKEQKLLMQTELERFKKMFEEESRYKVSLEEQALQMESDLNRKLKEVCDALDTVNTELAEERAKGAALSRRVELLDNIQEEQQVMQKELENYKEVLEESFRCQIRLEEQALQKESETKTKLKEVCESLNTSNSKLAEECEKAAALSRRVESFDYIKEEQCQMQKEQANYKKLLEESSRCQLCLEESTLRMKRESESKLKEVCDALDTANSELAEKICEGHAIEFELWIWKSIAEQLKAKLEENHKLRKALESSLLAQTEVGETIKQEKYVLVHELEEKDRRLSDAHQQIVSLEQEVKTRELEAASSARIETVMSFESEKESFHHITREKSMTLENLQKQIGWLEQESLGREIEGAVFAQIWAERASEHEKENLVQLIEQKDQRIDDLLQLVSSMEEKSNSSLHSVSSQLVEKQTEVNLVREVWEKVAAAQILAELEIEEKKLMIVELEDDIYKKQQKLELQEKSLSRGKQQALDIETELEAKQLEMEMLINQMEAKLRISDALVDELKSEKRNLVGDVMKLSSERENLLAFIGGQDDKINELSKEDMQLMGTLGRIVQSFDDSRSDVVLKGSGELFECVKENIDAHPSPTSKSLGAIFEERSPFRQLN